MDVWNDAIDKHEGGRPDNEVKQVFLDAEEKPSIYKNDGALCSMWYGPAPVFVGKAERFYIEDREGLIHSCAITKIVTGGMGGDKTYYAKFCQKVDYKST